MKLFFGKVRLQSALYGQRAANGGDSDQLTKKEDLKEADGPVDLYDEHMAENAVDFNEFFRAKYMDKVLEDWSLQQQADATIHR